MQQVLPENHWTTETTVHDIYDKNTLREESDIYSWSGNAVWVLFRDVATQHVLLPAYWQFVSNRQQKTWVANLTPQRKNASFIE